MYKNGTFGSYVQRAGGYDEWPAFIHGGVPKQKYQEQGAVRRGSAEEEEEGEAGEHEEEGPAGEEEEREKEADKRADVEEEAEECVVVPSLGRAKRRRGSARFT